ncbi:hypothetical protein BD626DRAFT_449032 [Schizophyllum amplum]|uniref:ZZ-type domain-containing protein n=1 Tax=Schizophyllum amplum TaxID=97359 RepID=A0A550D0B4_9AGAR|nr:hypothetical protein BD626DRAFT_449032 [Auriculariopsis ampla]
MPLEIDMARSTSRIGSPSHEPDIPNIQVTRPKVSQNVRATSADDRFEEYLEIARHTLKNQAHESSLQSRLNRAGKRFNIMCEFCSVSDTRSEDRVADGASEAASVANSELVQKFATSIVPKINHFAERSAVLVNVLDEISNIHPFISVAVLALKAIIKFELKRRENSQKVLALYVQMTEMMSVLEPLRLIRDSHHRAPDGTVLENTIRPLMPIIAQDITACGNVCDAYTNKSIIAKVIKSFTYEQRLAEYGEKFSQHHKSLHFAISLHTTMGVYQLDEKVSVNTKMLVEILHRLDSPREREISLRVSAKGGPNACMDNDTVLEQLARMDPRMGDRASSGDEKRQLRRDAQELSHVFYLKKKLQDDLDESLEENSQRFLGKLKAMKDDMIGALENVEKSVHRESDRIIDEMHRGPHARIKDKEIHELWQDMNWRKSVKSLHFTFALRDHLIEKSRRSVGRDGKVHGTSTNNTPPDLHSPGPTTYHVAHTDQLQDIGRAFLDTSQQRKRDTDDEQWAIDALTMVTIQPISEAFDDDGTGFISTHEVNALTSSRPEDWSLLRWLVYWGEGWYEALVDYRRKIWRTMQKLYSSLQDMHHANRNAVDQYLGHIAFQRIELLLRGLNRSRPTVNPSVLERVREYTRKEEDRLQHQLAEVRYEIDDRSTLEVVKGRSQRIERYIFPLLHLILCRHLEIIQSGATHLLNEADLATASQSLGQLMAAVDERVVRLNAVLRQSKADGQARLATYAFGMVKGDADNSTDDDVDRADDHADETVDATVDDANDDACATNRTDIVGHESKTPNIIPWEYDLSGYDDPPSMTTPNAHIAGSWTCSFVYYGGVLFGWVSGLLDVSFDVNEAGTVIGTGRCALANCTLEGTCKTAEEGVVTVNFDVFFHAVSWLSSTALYTLSFKGEYVDDTNMLSGSLDIIGSEIQQSVSFVRTPADIYRYRHRGEDGRSAISLWTFARDAVLSRVRRQRSTNPYFVQRLHEMTVYVGLQMRCIVNRSRLAGLRCLSQEELATLREMGTSIAPDDARFYLSIVSCRRRQLCIHFNAWCNACYRLIANDRYMCLQCTDDGLKDQIDLCAECRHQGATYNANSKTLEHKSSHTLARFGHVLHDKSKRTLHDDALQALERVKLIFGRLDGFPSVISSSVKPQSYGLSCRRKGCSHDITLPCMYCAHCYAFGQEDVFTCEGCRIPEHEHHVWLLVKKEALLPKLTAVEMRLEALEGKFASEQKGMSDRIEALEHKLGDRMEILERKLDMMLASLQIQ